MIALYIVLAVLLFIFLLLLVKIQIFFEYSDKLRLTVKYLFIKKTIVAPEEKPKAKKAEKKPKKEPQQQEKKKEKKKKQSYLSKLKDKKGISGIVSIFTSLARIASGLLKNVFKHIVIKRFDVDIVIVGSDASDTALKYGKLCAVIYPSLNIILSVTDTKDYKISVMPDFDDDAKSKVKVSSYAYARPIFLVYHLLIAGVKILIARAKL